MDVLDAATEYPSKDRPMKRFVRESLTPLLALACAATVFLAAALEAPDVARASSVSAPKAR